MAAIVIPYPREDARSARKDYQEEDCNSDNPELPPERFVATATYVSVTGRALWCQRLPRQVTGCHRCGRSEVECEEG